MEFQIGLDIITSYKRLSYQPWFALAEFIDNSTQAYFDNKVLLDASYKKKKQKLNVSIAYDKEMQKISISDNSVGMDEKELTRALHVAQRPPNTAGRSKFGMGMKTAACWLGNHWTIRTKKLGSSKEFIVIIDVDKIAAGDGALDFKELKATAIEDHHTIIEITKLNRPFHGRTKGKIKEYLSSIYRQDFRNDIFDLWWQAQRVEWKELDILKATDGAPYKRKFTFQVDDKNVQGWVGILGDGSRGRERAGFSIFHSGRIVKGYPDTWRPSSLYGQLQGSNDLVNQRLVGEIHLDEFEVSHTKDDILWLGDQEESVEKQLHEACKEYRSVAKDFRQKFAHHGPTELETRAAIEALTEELCSSEMADAIRLEEVPKQEVVDKLKRDIVKSETSNAPTWVGNIDELKFRLYHSTERSANDPYFICESPQKDDVIVIINANHPHISQIKGSDGLLNYFRDCVYDALAENKARSYMQKIDPDTVKLIKDKLLRVPLEIEMHKHDQ